MGLCNLEGLQSGRQVTLSVRCCMSVMVFLMLSRMPGMWSTAA